MRVSIIPLIVRKLRKALAIVQDTNTATRNIDAGKFVMWKGELCKALSAITTGDTLSSTNLEACTDGGLNVLNSKITIITGKLVSNDTSTSIPYPNGFTQENCIIIGYDFKTLGSSDITTGIGMYTNNDPSRLILSLRPNDIIVYQNNTTFRGADYRIALMKI